VVLTRRDFVAALSDVAKPASSSVVLDAKTGKILASSGRALSLRIHPGSTAKPFTAVALIDAGAIVPISCTGNLEISGRKLTCSHPVVTGPIDLPVALAYSCNQFFTANGTRLSTAALGAVLRRFGFEVETPITPAQRALMAIGEWGVRTTVAGLANAYSALARLTISSPTRYLELRKGMRAATEYGTARLARPAAGSISGKTGTSPAPDRLRTFALFAGWAPAEDPKVVVAASVSHGRGGGEAAPLARTLFEKHL
jgi:cell division protein FtsI/penicillin-binding protein 2